MPLVTNPKECNEDVVILIMASDFSPEPPIREEAMKAKK